MKKRKIIFLSGLVAGAFYVLTNLTGCESSGDPAPTPNGNVASYDLYAATGDEIEGELILSEYSDGSVNFVMELQNTSTGSTHPAAIYFDNAVDGTDIVLTLDPVDGATGGSQTRTTLFDDGSGFTFSQLLNYDGHVKVLTSPTDPAILSTGDIGQNAFTATTISYGIEEIDASGISGTLHLQERLNGETLASLELEGTDAQQTYPAHIHVNSAVEGGAIAVSLHPYEAEISLTNIAALDASAGGQSVTYDDLVSFDGHINVHASPTALETIVSQGDIGENLLTGETITHILEERNASGITGEITFHERVSGATLVEISLLNTLAGNMHPSHIHVGTAAQEDAGAKAVILNPVMGETGKSLTHVENLDAAVGGTPISYSDFLEFEGYVNIHTSMANLDLLAQTDIGISALTGESISFTLDEIPGVTGTATFYERRSGKTLVVVYLEGAPITGDHPAHIHKGSIANGPGAIEITLNPVNSFGYSRTSVSQSDATAGSTALEYADMVVYDGHINVHESMANLSNIIGSGNIGINAG